MDHSTADLQFNWNGLSQRENMLLFGTTASKPVKLEPSCRAILPRTLIVPLLCTHLNEAYDVQIGNNKFQNFSAKIFSGRFTADLNLENFLIGL